MKHLVLFVFLITCAVSCHSPQKNLEPEKVKVALRTIGHELLLAQKDSTSLVLPVESLSEDSYRLKFQYNLMIKPRDLVSIVKRVFEDVSLSEDYILEVSECENGEVAYSYQVYQKENIEIIP
ncbi:MAG: winged helix family transcriptional regulator, partial [Mangrovimonas sp.]|nr:winged helix family transcriptional regulator [Mangrovimonas sp.]